MVWQGLLCSFGAAIANSCMDGFRKYGSSLILPHELVPLVAVLDAVISISFVAITGGFNNVHIHRPHNFWSAVIIGSLLQLFSKLLYQKALTLSPLSMTVPYTSFTPAIVVVVAYFAVGEDPSLFGIIGVITIATAGYLLSLHPSAPSEKATNTDEKYSKVRSSPSNTLLPDIESLKSGVPMHTHLLYKLRTQIALLQKEPGMVLMLLVAALWSATASLDKIGILMAPSLMVYLAAQRLVFGAVSLVYLVTTSRKSFSLYWKHPRLLIILSLVELSAVVLFLEAIEYIFVSYVVAIKRCSILLSVIIGAVCFKEDVWSRIPYIMFMLLGVFFIVLEPNAMPVHHTHTHLRSVKMMM